jgi:hypothetical protein
MVCSAKSAQVLRLASLGFDGLPLPPRQYFVLYKEGGFFVGELGGVELLLVFTALDRALMFLENQGERFQGWTAVLVHWDKIVKGINGIFKRAIVDSKGLPNDGIFTIPIA